MASESGIPWFGTIGLSFSRDEYPILSDLDFAVAPGEIHALVGMHNSGKSTLCSLLSGLLAPDSGRIAAAGKLYPAMTLKRAEELGVARVAGTPIGFAKLSVLEVFIAGRTGWWLGLSPRRRYERLVRNWLDQHGIRLPVDRQMRDLPRDHRIAVEVLSCLYRSPKFLLLDEAMEELDSGWHRLILPIIRNQVDGGMSVVWVTHKIEDALSIADNITVMRRGKTILTGRTGGMERLNLIRLCYDQLDNLDGNFSDRAAFEELMRYTKAMLNDLPTAVIVVDNNFRSRFVNRSGRELFACELSDDPFTSTNGNDRLRRAVEQLLQGDSQAELHSFPIRADGDETLVDIRVQPIVENSLRVGAMVIIEDVSLREDLRRRLVLSEKLASVGLLAAGVAHEVNNPLEIIGNYLNFLDEEPLSHQAKKAVAKMEIEVSRIQQIVKNLVAYSGRRPGEASANPGELLEELMDLLQVHLRPRAIEFVRRDANGSIHLAIDPNELRQVFLNLIMNSLDAMPDGGRIEMRIDVDDNDSAMGKLCLVDSGPGIQLDNPNDAFLPFVTTKKNQASHQGLGLYVVYSIIEKYNGSIAVRNRQEGGCEFIVRLPLSAPYLQT